MQPLRLLATQCGSEVHVQTDALGCYEAEFDYLCRSLRRLGVASSDVEDLAHEVFLVLYRRWDEYDPTRALRPYLFGIAFRVVAAHRRRRRLEVPCESLELRDERPTPDQTLFAKESRALLLMALQQVPLERRAVLVMHDIDEIRMQEIAKNLRIPRFTGYSRLRKARRELQAAIQRLRQGAG